MKRTRKSIRYRIFHWFNTLTHEDINRAKALTFSIIEEIITAILLIAAILIIPSLFH